MKPSQVNVHITKEYFTARMFEDRGGLELFMRDSYSYPLEALPAFEATLRERGYVQLPGVFDWLRHYEQRTVMLAEGKPTFEPLPFDVPDGSDKEPVA